VTVRVCVFVPPVVPHIVTEQLPESDHPETAQFTGAGGGVVAGGVVGVLEGVPEGVPEGAPAGEGARPLDDGGDFFPPITPPAYSPPTIIAAQNERTISPIIIVTPVFILLMSDIILEYKPFLEGPPWHTRHTDRSECGANQGRPFGPS